ncbi:MAG: DegV family protein [Anaerolineae bacterium]|jgi:DegV family protein with EDD domain|nr:DegV family protein [Anaerolineae bacterium]
MKVAVVTDTDASLTIELAKEYGIRLVPITVQFGEESFDSEFEILDEEVFSRIDAAGKLPTTAAPSPGKWAEGFQAAFDEGADAVLCFTVSRNLSATYDAAVMAATDLLEGKNITVVDTNSLSMAQGFMAMEAATVLKNGGSIEEAIAAAKSYEGRTYLYGALATLRYLAMSGRVGQLAAGMANMLNIKPILTMQNGKLELLEKIRTQKKAWMRMIELLREKAGDRKIEKVAILHVACLEEAKRFEELLRKHLDIPEEVIICSMTAGLSVHTGAGLVGVTLVTEK